MKFTALIVLILGCFTVLYGCVSRQDVIALDSRLNELEQLYVKLAQLHELSKKNNENLQAKLKSHSETTAKKNQNTKNVSAKLYAEIDSLREENRVIDGKIEEFEYALKHKIGAVENLKSSRKNSVNGVQKLANINKERLVRLERYLDFEPSKLVLKRQSDFDNKANLSENQIYAIAKQHFEQDDFENAREMFTVLIKQYPNSKNADNAQFWIGESFYCEKWYEKAVVEYQKVVEKYPNGNKAQAALLKQGLAFLKLDDKTNARFVLKELVKKFPKSNETKIANKKLKEF